VTAWGSTLLIDDDAGFAQSFRDFMDSERFSIDTATSWEAGLGLFRVGMHELVIADYNLPGSHHGLRLLAAVRNLRPSTELILISGALPSDAQDLVNTSSLVDGFFRKDEKLGDVVLPQVRAASERTGASTDWRAVADAYIRRRRVDSAELKRIDDYMRDRLPRR
jgi:DNA-binding response OmpR family regulator